ncbi:MAG: hypothetical protein ACOX2O_06355 [Bdellovibrionota bacterium]|jgi:hypothetical protein
MKIEYRLEALSECPSLRIYDFDNTEARQLRELFIQLAEGENDWTSLHEIDNIEAVDGCVVNMRVGAWDRGVKKFDESHKFEWILTEESWKDLAKIAEAFCEEDSEVNQEWLDKRGEVAVLIERHER